MVVRFLKVVDCNYNQDKQYKIQFQMKLRFFVSTKNVDEIDTGMSHLLIYGRRMGYFVICLKKRLLTLPLM